MTYSLKTYLMPHHAYIYEGPLSLLSELSADARERFGFSAEQSADTHMREFEKFGIDESRWLVGTAALKPASGRGLFVLGIASITTEAQQALLKLLEEPQQGVMFVLLVPHGTLLPTVLSRMQRYPEALELATQKPSAFLKASGKDRSDMIAKMLKDDEGVKERVRELLDGLEAELHKKIADPAARAALADIALVRDYIRDRSPSMKMLLEHLALSLPIF